MSKNDVNRTAFRLLVRRVFAASLPGALMVLVVGCPEVVVDVPSIEIEPPEAEPFCNTFMQEGCSSGQFCDASDRLSEQVRQQSRLPRRPRHAGDSNAKSSRGPKEGDSVRASDICCVLIRLTIMF